MSNRKNELVSKINLSYSRNGKTIPSFYADLVAEYFLCMSNFNQMPNIENIIPQLPMLLESVYERNDGFYGSIYGETKNRSITMNSNLPQDIKTKYFFHELTHAIQTKNINGLETQALFNGTNGMFFTEATTQFIGEIIFNEYEYSHGRVSDLTEKIRPGAVRGQENHTPRTILSEYEYNGDILALFAKSTGMTLPEIAAMTFQSDCRKKMKQKYESISGNEGRFEQLMDKLEKIYILDKCSLVSSNIPDLRSNVPQNIPYNGGYFKGNFDIENQLMEETQIDLMTTYLMNNSVDHVLEHSKSEILPYITSDKLKQHFIKLVTGEQYLNSDIEQEETNVQR